MPELTKRPTFARSESHFLPGMFVLGASVAPQSIPDVIAAAKKSMESLAAGPVTLSELDRARNEVVTELNTLLSKPDALSDNWLDQDTYRLSDVQPSPAAVVNSITPADVQRLAARLLTGPAATVVLGDPQQLKTALQARVPFEVFGEIAPPVTPAPTPPKAATRPTPE